MIRNLFIIAGAGLVLSIGCIAGAAALGGADLKRHDWSWTFHDDDGETVRIERARAERGPDVTRTLAWNGSDTLEVELAGEVTYVPGAEAGVVITGAKSAVDRVRVENGRVYMTRDAERVTFGWRNGELTGWSDNDDLRIVVTAPSITRFDLSGSGRLKITDYDQPTLTLDMSGSGEVEATGKTTTLAIDMSGSGEADMRALTTRDATVEISGSGEASLAPTGKADIDIAGSGDVYLTTRPATITRDISGSGDVHEE